MTFRKTLPVVSLSGSAITTSVTKAKTALPHRKLILVLFFLVLVLSPFINRAQTDSLSYYFDDGGISTGNMIKTDLISIIHGDLPLIVEFSSKNQLALEAGVGLLLPYYVHDFLALAFTDNRGIENDQFGYSTRLHLKWYHSVSEKEYWGVQYYRRAFQELTANEWFFTKGDQRVIGKRLLIDVALGLGVRFQKSKGTEYLFDPDYSFTPIVPLMIRFGYITRN